MAGNSSQGGQALERLNALARHVGDSRKRRPQAFVDASSAVAQVLSLPWFNRRRIVQESVLNSDVLIVCGSAEISWLRFNMIAQAVLSSGATGMRNSQAATSLTMMFDLWKNWALAVPGADQCRMVRLLERFDHFQCGDGRERIYAFLSLASEVWPSNHFASELQRPSNSRSRDLKGRDSSQVNWLVD